MSKPFIIPNPVTNPLASAKTILTSVGLQYVRPRFFKVDDAAIAAEDALGQSLNIPDKNSWFGTPVFDTLKFDAINYLDVSNTSQVETASLQANNTISTQQSLNRDAQKGAQISVPEMTLENVLFVITPTKNVVRTPIAGGNGTVKEYIGMGDYEIQITIQLVGRHANVPPEQELRQLLSFIKAPIPLPVYNNILSYFDIYTIVVVDQPSITQVSGARNVFNVTIPCVSDKPFEVEYRAQVHSVRNSNNRNAFG